MGTTYLLIVEFLAADNKFGVVWLQLSIPYLFLKENELFVYK